MTIAEFTRLWYANSWWKEEIVRIPEDDFYELEDEVRALNKKIHGYGFCWASPKHPGLNHFLLKGKPVSIG